MDFQPPIAGRTTHELLGIAADEGNWVPEARALARVELEKRGVPTEKVRAIETTVKAASLADHVQREHNATVSYSAMQLLGILLVAPFLMIGKLVALKLHLGIKLGLTALDRDNFKKKYRQRMAALVAGVVFWVVLLKAII
jgi:hypothetical protein